MQKYYGRGSKWRDLYTFKTVGGASCHASIQCHEEGQNFFLTPEELELCFTGMSGDFGLPPKTYFENILGKTVLKEGVKVTETLPWPAQSIEEALWIDERHSSLLRNTELHYL
jgi:hypothetical protein